MKQETLQLRQQIEQVRPPPPLSRCMHVVPRVPALRCCLDITSRTPFEHREHSATSPSARSGLGATASRQRLRPVRVGMPQLKVIRAERQRREELLALAELRASVQALQQVDSAAQEQRQEVPVTFICASGPYC